MVEINSDILRVIIDEEGAQLHSIYNKSEDLEYLWQRENTIWASSAPVVFPVIGKLNNLSYQQDGKTYTMKSNGIIRYEKLKVVEKAKEYVTFHLQNSERTLMQYPYAFEFLITYRIKDNNLIICTKIINKNSKVMYYNYAGHPGFNIPMYKEESCNDYYVEFETDEHLNIYDVCDTGQLVNHSIPFLDNERRIFIRKNLFQKEALVFQHPKSRYLTIKSLRHEKQIRVYFEGFDNLAIWSPYNINEPLRFICIEPWIGHTDFKGYEGEFSQRDEVACLGVGKQREHVFRIEFR